MALLPFANASGSSGGSGTVTSVSVAPANGFSGTVANATTTPAITIIAGAITPTSVNSVTISGSSTPTLAVTGTSTISGANTGDQTITLTSDVTGSGTGSFATTIRSSVALAGSPTTTTQASTDNSTKIATTAYVTTGISNAIAGVNPAVAVQWATTAAGDTSGLTYSNGVSGVGATLTGVNNAVTTVDGHAFVVGDVGVTRLLIKNDTQSPSGAFNGVYLFTALHTVGTGDIFTRALDYDTTSDINNTGAIPVVNGTANALTSWLLTSSVSTVGTDPLTYTKFSINPTTQLTTTLTSAHLLVGNGSNIATDTAITGDVTISNAGVTSYNNVVGPAKGGTGIANNASSTLTISGNFATTLTITAGTSVTLPTSGTLATLAGTETLTNKLVSDAFMGNSFQSQSATLESPALLSSTDFIYDNILEIGATKTLEIPATSSLEVEAYVDQAFVNTQTGTAPDANNSFISQSGLNQNVTLPVATDFLSVNTLDVSIGHSLEVPATSSLEIAGFYGPGSTISVMNLYNPYKFSTYRNAAATTGNAAFALITFDVKDFDTSNNYSTVTGLFTCPVPGFYFFTSTMNVSTGTTAIISLFKNGSEYKRGNQAGSTGSYVVVVYDQFTTGDTVGIEAFGSAADTLTVGTGPKQTYFSGCLMTPT